MTMSVKQYLLAREKEVCACVCVCLCLCVCVCVNGWLLASTLPTQQLRTCALWRVFVYILHSAARQLVCTVHASRAHIQSTPQLPTNADPPTPLTPPCTDLTGLDWLSK